ncbi:MAG: arginine decarboxylase, pyruvoyl-dependent, partial [Candidatus Omnitrophica bacterium]|nr:arginine decarboxylase, pyruvoyl-dependent [Candidatus Omnitrophota bacterium]
MNNSQQQGTQQSSVPEEEKSIKLVNLVPTKVFFTKGVGTHKEELRSYELALKDAGIEKCNLVNVSSIFPPGCKIISKSEGIKELALVPGMITYCVMARCSSNEPRRLIAASVGSAIPAEEGMYGYLSEHHAYGHTDEIAGDYAEELAATRANLGWPYEAFEIPEEVREICNNQVEEKKLRHASWQRKFDTWHAANPEKAKLW